MESLLQNQVFAGGFTLMIIGGALAYAHSLVWSLIELIMQRFILRVEISSNEEAYRWIMQWLSNERVFKTSSRLSLVVKQKLSRMSAIRKAMNEEVISRDPPKILYMPGPGFHIIWYRKRPIFLWRTVTEANVANSFTGQLVNTIESLSITAPWADVSIVNDLVKDAMNFAYEQDHGRTIIYTLETNFGSGWARAIARPQRPLDSVILDTNVGEELINDATEFFNSADWYRDLGVPYRRCYLFYGKPGCGKTSFVAALAGKLNLNVCVLTLSAKNLNDYVINQCLNEAPANAIILLEDIDAAFPSREKKKGDKSVFDNPSMVTFSGLLNAIDGIASQEGRLFIMTTNYYNRLDPALIRPGRVDVSIHFGLASKRQINRMFLRFYPNHEKLATEFAETLGEERVSMAQLQGHFLTAKGDANKAFITCGKLIDQINREKKQEEEKAAEEAKEEKEEEEKKEK